MGRRVVVAGLVVVLILLAAGGSLRSETQRKQGPNDLAKAKVEVARRALERIELRRTNAPDPAPEIRGVIAWSRRLMEAETAVAQNRADKIAAAKGRVDRMNIWYEIAVAQQEIARGAADNVDLLEYYRLEAKERLLQASLE